jgi:GTPase SAR1 family protein
MRDDNDEIESISAAEWPAWLARANDERCERIWVLGVKSPWDTERILGWRLEAIERNPSPLRIVRLNEPLDEDAFQPWPTALTELRLEFCGVTASGLAHLAGLEQLQTLYLWGNQIDGAGLAHLAGLEQLQTLYLDGNAITSIDLAILKTHDARQILAAVRGSTRLHHARIVWIGMGGVGKSWLARRVFRNELIPQSQRHIHDETHDIQLLRPEDCWWKPRIQGVGGLLDIEPHIWDFAGQLVTHGVHESFLDDDGRTVYVLTLSARRDPDRPTRTKHDERTWNRLGYWLQTIHHFVGPHAPVVLAITQCDDVDTPRPIDAELPQAPYGVKRCLNTLTPDEIGGPYGVAVTALVDDCSAAEAELPIEPLRESIERALQTLSVVKDGKVHPLLPKLRTHVAQELGTRLFATVAEFAGWCRACDIVGQDIDGFLASLHYLGTLIHFGERKEAIREVERWSPRHEQTPADEPWFRPVGTAALQGHLFNPVWFKTCVYGVMRETARTDGPARDGWLDEAALDRLVQTTSTVLFPEVTWDKAWLSLVREALVHIRLCWHDDRRRRYLFPRALPPLVAPYAKSWPTCELVWNFLPEANVLRLLVELHRGGYVVEEEGVYQHGRNGALIEYPRGSGQRALVLGDPDAGRIELRFDPSGEPTWADRLVHWLQAKLEDDIQRIPVLRPPVVPRWGERKPIVTSPVVPPPTIPTSPVVSRGRKQKIRLGERAIAELELQKYEQAKAQWPKMSGTYSYAKHAEVQLGMAHEEHQSEYGVRLDTAQHYRRALWKAWVKYRTDHPKGTLLEFLRTRTTADDQPEDVNKAARAFEYLLPPPPEGPPRKRNKSQ